MPFPQIPLRRRPGVTSRSSRSLFPKSHQQREPSVTRTPGSSAFDVQSDVRAPWRRYVDALASFRPALHGYCCRLTGNVWDGEDLLQDTLLRVFGLLGKIDRDLENPKAY